MDTKRIALAGILAVVGFIVFTQVKKLTAVQPSAPVAAPKIIKQVEYLDVLVAAQDMNFGSKVREETLMWKPWPAESLSPNFITSNSQPDAIQSMAGHVTRTTVYTGEPIISRKFIAPGDKGVMAALLRPGMRAVTTRISVDTAAGGFIQPGDRVDIILTEDLPQTRLAGEFTTSQRRSVSSTIFENVKVLAIDQRYANADGLGAAVVGSTATFEMTQGDSELLQETEARGDLTLTLRGITDATNGYAASSAKIKRDEASEVSTLSVYRGGQPQVVALKGN